MSTTERDFFEQVAKTYDVWLAGAIEAIENPEAGSRWSENVESYRILAKVMSGSTEKEAIRKVIRELLAGQLFSLFVIFDGGSALSDVTSLSIVDGSNERFPDGLHERFVEYLFETGRQA